MCDRACVMLPIMLHFGVVGMLDLLLVILRSCLSLACRVNNLVQYPVGVFKLFNSVFISHHTGLCRLQLGSLFTHFLLPLLQNSFPAAQLAFFPFNLPFHGQDVGTLMSFKGWLSGLPVVGSGISTCRIFCRCFCCFCDVVLLCHCCISEQRCVACEYHVLRTRFDDTHLCNSFSARLEVSGLWWDHNWHLVQDLWWGSCPMLAWARKAILLSCGLLVAIEPAQHRSRFWGPSRSSGFTGFWCPCIILAATSCIPWVRLLKLSDMVQCDIALLPDAVGLVSVPPIAPVTHVGKRFVSDAYRDELSSSAVWLGLWASSLYVDTSPLLVGCSVVGICSLLYRWTSRCVSQSVAHSIGLAVSSWFGYALMSAAHFGGLGALSWSMAEIESPLRLHAGRLVACFSCLMAWLIFCKHVFKCSFKIWGFVDAQPWMIDGRSVSIKLSVPFPFTRIVVLVW